MADFGSLNKNYKYIGKVNDKLFMKNMIRKSAIKKLSGIIFTALTGISPLNSSGFIRNL
jgi:hypothetical protein